MIITCPTQIYSGGKFEEVGKSQEQNDAAEEFRARQQNSQQTTDFPLPAVLGLSLLALGMAVTLPRLASRWLARFQSESTPLPAYTDIFAKSQFNSSALVTYLRMAQTQPDKSTSVFEWFGTAALEQAHVVREHFASCGSIQQATLRKEALAGLMGLIQRLLEECQAPELAAVRELAIHLDGLAQQVSDQPGIVTSFTLRTIENAITVLGRIRPSEFKGDLATSPSRFLVVDDDPISRHAVSIALKKAFKSPDVAENGESAIRMAAERPYNVIFLDVEMPGLDRVTEANKYTPVIFVTSHRDMETRSKSARAGGHDLLGKPFLSKELTVKSLSLVLGGKLDADANVQPSPEAESGNPLEIRNPAAIATTLASNEREPIDSPISFSPATDWSDLRKKLHSLQRARSIQDQETILRLIYTGLHELAGQADPGRQGAISRLVSSTQALVEKIRSTPHLQSRPVIDTMSVAIQVMDDLCAHDFEGDLEEAPLRILLVDDDPFALRATSNALNLKVGRPECASDGEEALALCGKKAYDVIFLDICMPGMDGLEACAKIRSSEFNKLTPVVFITSADGLERRSRYSGGSAFVPKPVHPAHVALAALTYALQGRLAGADEVCEHSSSTTVLAQAT